MLREHVGVAAGNGLFAVIGQSGSGTGWSIRTSPDGITWTERATGATGYFAGIVYGAGRGFAAVGSRTGSTTTMGIALTSPDGITWTAQPDATTSIDTTILALTSGRRALRRRRLRRRHLHLADRRARLRRRQVPQRGTGHLDRRRELDSSEPAPRSAGHQRRHLHRGPRGPAGWVAVGLYESVLTHP